MAFEKIFAGSPIDNQVISPASPQNPQLGVDTDSDNLWLNSGNGWILVATAVKNFSNNEVPSGTVNGINTLFTLAHTPVANSQTVFMGGVLQQPGAGKDYTISGKNITFAVAPNVTVLVNYQY